MAKTKKRRMKPRAGLRPPFPTDSFVTNYSPSATPPTSAPPTTSSRQTMRYSSVHSQLQLLPEITVVPPSPTPSMLPLGYEEIIAADYKPKCEAEMPKAAEKRARKVPSRRFILLASSVGLLLVLAILLIRFFLLAFK
ncbi:hypothetical protein GPALN_005257 [Globodera pallida]|nr:hypothetical protein GPALN_005257 [Globodera pallida]